MDNINGKDGWLVTKLRRIPLAGFILAVLSAAIFATGSFMVELTPNIHPIEVVITRSITQLCFVVPYNLYASCSFKGAAGERWHLFTRGILGFLAFSLAYSAFHVLPLGDASTIIFSAPVYVSIFAYFMLGEACGISQGVVILFTCSGVVLISKPSFIFGSPEAVEDTSFPLEGIAMSFGASLCQALSFISMRKLQKTPAGVVIAWLSGVSVIMGVTALISLHYTLGQIVVTWPTEYTQKEWLCLIANGICGTFGQLFLTVACKIEEAGFVSLARTFDIVVAFTYQVTLLGESISWTSILGATIVICGVTTSAVKRVILDRKALKFVIRKEL
ncbi:Solute carrier family 35 member G1 [Halotydeus destructor]|nr:Solute carrier family 35 member G1 [Halotydeus destructor]